MSKCLHHSHAAAATGSGFGVLSLVRHSAIADRSDDGYIPEDLSQMQANRKHSNAKQAHLDIGIWTFIRHSSFGFRHSKLCYYHQHLLHKITDNLIS